MEDHSNVDFLVVAAHAPEMEGLRGLLGDGFRATVGEVRVAAVAVGIGLVASASGTMGALHAYAPRAVIQLGTCGVYTHRRLQDHQPPIVIGQVVVARRIHLASVASVDGRGILPTAMRVSVDADRALASALCGGDATMADVATTLAITTDEALAGHLALAHSCDVEHLEAFAVAQACASRSVPFAAVFAAANDVGAQAHDQWRAHHQAAGARAAAHVATWLKAGAPR